MPKLSLQDQMIKTAFDFKIARTNAVDTTVKEEDTVEEV